MSARSTHAAATWRTAKYLWSELIDPASASQRHHRKAGGAWDRPREVQGDGVSVGRRFQMRLAEPALSQEREQFGIHRLTSERPGRRFVQPEETPGIADAIDQSILAVRLSDLFRHSRPHGMRYRAEAFTDRRGRTALRVLTPERLQGLP